MYSPSHGWLWPSPAPHLTTGSSGSELTWALWTGSWSPRNGGRVMHAHISPKISKPVSQPRVWGGPRRGRGHREWEGVGFHPTYFMPGNCVQKPALIIRADSHIRVLPEELIRTRLILLRRELSQVASSSLTTCHHPNPRFVIPWSL